MITVYNRYGNGAYYTRSGSDEKHILPSSMEAREARIKNAQLEDADEELEEIMDWLSDNSQTHPDWERKIQRLSQVEIMIRRLEFVRSPVNTAAPETINIIR